MIEIALTHNGKELCGVVCTTLEGGYKRLQTTKDDWEVDDDLNIVNKSHFVFDGFKVTRQIDGVRIIVDSIPRKVYDIQLNTRRIVISPEDALIFEAGRIRIKNQE
jgi:hypothetical protein